MYDRIARVEHVDHARRSAQHCVKALLSAQTHTYVRVSFSVLNFLGHGINMSVFSPL